MLWSKLGNRSVDESTLDDHDSCFGGKISAFAGWGMRFTVTAVILLRMDSCQTPQFRQILGRSCVTVCLTAHYWSCRSVNSANFPDVKFITEFQNGYFEFLAVN